MTHRAYLALAIPLIISTVTTPLLGAVDTAVVGQLSDPAYIGGVAVGSMIFNTMYWLFGFLRVSTSGFTAQASGAQDETQCLQCFIRPLVVGLGIGFMFIAMQSPILSVALALLQPERDVAAFVEQYFSIRIWGAPFALANYAILGWLIGMGRVKTSLSLQVGMNVLNIALDVWFVTVLREGVGGVAMATFIAEASAFAIGIAIVRRLVNIRLSDLFAREGWNAAEWKRMMAVNGDLLLRTVCLLAVFNTLTAKGAAFGTKVLAANAILIQIHYLMAYVFDGFANASSILVGKAVGARDERLYARTLSLSLQWTVLAALSIMLAYIWIDDEVIRLFTNNRDVFELAVSYSAWMAAYPLAAGYGLVFYGVFTGAAKTAPIRNSMLFSLACYLLLFVILPPALGNHGLWLAFIAFSLGRSLFLAMYVPKLERSLFPK
ncbi:MATE family efflux transporter [Geobacillus sp. BMUD]|uniref:MATE family efflux transporter n=1 Tax=Geobacillus sp. BMUD TaxID=2508876 RepID=UPI001492B7DE|nr:MATE family efflux transporter [Geobacillus sp. BMUD]NNU82519.1 MATE family efflux transporter [Geobacillus sp. BMUD]